MELLRWQVGDARVVRIADVDATAALQGLIPKFNPAFVSRAAWLTPNFVDGVGRLLGLVQAFLIMIDRLQAAGVEPGGVDYVGNTHLHFDHVGWHTQLVNGTWQPTFPAARYVMSAEEILARSPIQIGAHRTSMPVKLRLRG